MENRKFQLDYIQVLKGKNKRNLKYIKVEPEILHSNTPSGAASKIFTKFCKLNKNKLQECKVDLIVKDIETDKKFSYQFERVYDPVTVKINGKDVTYNYKNNKKSIK